MSSPKPKLLRILEAVKTRVEAIRTSSGYTFNIGADVRLDEREPDENDLPCANVWFEPGVIGDVQNERQRVDQTINVVGYVPLTEEGGHADGCRLLADIQRAVEIADRNLDGLLLDVLYGIQPQSFDIIQPEKGVNAVAARITYAVPHIRKSGDPEIV